MVIDTPVCVNGDLLPSQKIEPQTLSQVIIYSDHNPLSFLTETASKSAKLIRWVLALHCKNLIYYLNFVLGI